MRELGAAGGGKAGGGKAAAAKGKDAPAFSEICDACKLYLDADLEIPLPLLARLVKFRLLIIKDADIKSRKARACSIGAFYLRQGGNVFTCVCTSVCLSVSLSFSLSLSPLLSGGIQYM